MAVELKKLYEEIRFKYNVHLETESCFDKQISWLHILENIEFAQFLHGDELVFNSSLNEASILDRKNYIDQLLLTNAGGLIVSVQDGREFSQELIDYCNEKRFPLLTTSWETPFIKITRIFSEILIDNERTGMDLIAALKEALGHPEDISSYLPHFENNHYPATDKYVVSIIGFQDGESVYFTECMNRITKGLPSMFDHCVFYRENNLLVILTRGYTVDDIANSFSAMATRFSDMHFAIGSEEMQLTDIYLSYHNAKQTYHLCNRIFDKNLLCYKDLGVYQLLVDMKNPEIICPAFINMILGKLIDYDKANKTKYLDILKDFFKNDCSITQTSAATFYHQNTLKYKVKTIKEILGYDITTNENRIRIMLALYLLELI